MGNRLPDHKDNKMTTARSSQHRQRQSPAAARRILGKRRFLGFPAGALNYFLAQAMARLGQQHAIRDQPAPAGARAPPSPPNLQLPPRRPQVGNTEER
eukprot:1623926-Prymnesium_polylepis.2